MAVTQALKRVERLETATGGGGECPECGWGGGDDFGPNDTYELTWVDPGGAEDKDEFCESCGRQLVIRITWGDEAT
jgi:predicted RNA-binding Zn-ribbon protein involved in translation (DUF1610 family)